jgi:hypothetical protein
MPRVRSLIHRVCCSTEPYPRLYPSQLRELNVGLKRKADDDDEIDAIVAHMENLRSASGLRSLTLTLPQFRRYHLHQRVSLASLECMKELESLTLIHGTSLLPEQLVHIRRLPSLRTLSFGGLSRWQVEALLEDRPDCPPLQLHHLGGIDKLDLQGAQLLVRIPTLQRVESYRIMPDALQLLAHGLPDLHTLVVNVLDWSPDERLAAVRESVAVCHQLTALKLMWISMDDLAALRRALPPSLRKLDILYCPGFVQSDAFFQCVAEGGLRQLQQLHVSLAFDEDESDPALNAAWLTRLDVCAPWITAVLREM